ncbi:hypothetical protein FUA23_13350 [Neolewinella aurantiaca]|uniref:Gliding motility protein GldL-like N-terminal domain-containing protein n=1 Tax=Neolewinella aurantiaca TaxID=2602767 RepID=A0A5C7FQW5_9BACT|nr:hypothetical protein [Neolewinella aurantiaca]TXF88829.1 hypothetical protein FUA23_13350 [Neolewinella aurantiaca]
MKILLITGIALSTIIVFVGAVFKLQSWPGSDYLIPVGLAGEVLCVAGLFYYLTTTGKKPDAELELDPNEVPRTVEEVEAEINTDKNQYG